MLGRIMTKMYRKLGVLIATILIISSVYVPEINTYAMGMASETDAYIEEASDDSKKEIATAGDAEIVSDVKDTTTTTDESILEVEPNQEINDEGSLVDMANNGTIRPTVNYSVHAQSYGWMTQVKDGERAGVVGKSKRIEAIAMSVNTNGIVGEDGNPITGGIMFRTHVQGIGWQDWVSGDADGDSVTMNINKKNYGGTIGQAKRVEAIEIKLTGELSEKYDVFYRVHGQSYGWQTARANGETAGYVGQKKRLEAIEIIIVEKNAAISASLTYAVHSQTYGWMNPVTVSVGQGNASTITGTVGQGKRLEAFKVSLNTQGITGGIEYKAHVQSYGWQNPVSNGGVAGTQGASKRLEAITIELTGQAASYFDVYYRVHVQSLGWLDWAKNGQKAGTQGGGRRIEAVQIYLAKRGAKAPGSIKNAFYNYNGTGWKNAPGELVIKVNKQMNCITVYKGAVPIKAIVCSTGNATPIGTFPLKSKWRWKQLFGGVYGQYSCHITGQILFHSVPYMSANIYALNTGYYNKLGETASAGCIRLTTADAKWIYDHCPTGTKVVIYNSSYVGPLGKPAAQKLPAGQTWDPTDPLIN